MDAVTSPRNSSSHRLAAPFIASTLENLLPSASRQMSGSASMSEWKVLPNQFSRAMKPLARWPVTNSPPFHSPIISSMVAGDRVSQKASRSASAIWPVLSLNATNVFRADVVGGVVGGAIVHPSLSGRGQAVPTGGELEERVVLVGRGDGHPHPVPAVGTDHDPVFGSAVDEVRSALAER